MRTPTTHRANSVLRYPLPRPTPYSLGSAAARAGGSLKGLPYGPGHRQEEFMQGYQDETLAMLNETNLEAA